MKNKYLFLLWSFFAVFTAFSQSAPLVEATVTQDIAVCNIGDATTLSVTHTNLLPTTSYAMAPGPTPYSAYPYSGGTLLQIPPTGMNQDDFWSTIIPLTPASTPPQPPFQFSFYGQTYSNVQLASNGILTFNTIYNFGDFCDWIGSNAERLPNANLYPNSIYGVYQDIDFAGRNPLISDINYYILDTGPNAAPNRVFVFNINQIPSWPVGSPGGLQTSQIVLHETSNIIEINVQRRNPSTAWNGSSIIGMQNGTASQFFTPPGQNNPIPPVAINNTSFVITPNPVIAAPGTPLPVSIIWKDALGNVVGTGDTFNATATAANTTFTAHVDLTDANGNIVPLVVPYTVEVGALPNVVAPSAVCVDLTSATPPTTVNINQDSGMITAPDSPSNYEITYFERLIDAQNDSFGARIPNTAAYPFNTANFPQTIYVLIKDGAGAGCSTIKSFTLDECLCTVVATPTTPPAALCENESLPSAGLVYTATGITNGEISTDAGDGPLPAGLSGAYNASTKEFQITGAPTTAGTYTFFVKITTATGSCKKSVTIVVKDVSKISLDATAGANNQQVCIGTALVSMKYKIEGSATGASITTGALPAGVTTAFDATNKILTIAGTPTAVVVPGNFDFTITTTGGCTPDATINGRITVRDVSKISLDATAGANNQAVCQGTAIVPVKYKIEGTATGASITVGALPAGVVATYDATLNVLTLSGTPTTAALPGNFDYTITTSGGCTPAATIVGRITVNDFSKISLDAAAGANAQAVCRGEAIVAMQYKIEGTATAAAITLGTLPAGVTSSFNALTKILTISGTPTMAVTPGNFDYTITTSGGCTPHATITGRITVKGISAIALDTTAGANNQQVCQGDAIVAMKYFITGGATGASIVTGALPAGVVTAYDTTTNVLTISGSPTTAAAPGNFDFTINTSGGCLPAAVINGRITVKDISKISLDPTGGVNNQSVCPGQAIVAMGYKVEGTATGAAITVGGLPTGVTSAYNATTNILTISGTPGLTVVPGNFDFTVTTSGGCAPNATITGRITVKDVSKISLDATAGANAQAICRGEALVAVKYKIEGGATGASITVGALPAGIVTSYDTTNNVLTISGTPTVTVVPGNFDYTITTSGGCSPAATIVGRITIKDISKISSDATGGTNNQIVCHGTSIVPMKYKIEGGATGASVTVGTLPAGIVATYDTTLNILTLSGAPTIAAVPGDFDFTISTSGGCLPDATILGRITVEDISKITLDATAGLNAQAVCRGEAIIAMQYKIEGSATGASITVGTLPAGITSAYNTATNVLTISGAPTAVVTPGDFDFTITTSGGCSPDATILGRITVKDISKITLDATAGANNQQVCQGAAIVPMKYKVEGSANGASITLGALPAGVITSYDTTNNVLTISGTPTTAATPGNFDFTITTSGGCTPDATITGRITVRDVSTISLDPTAGANAQAVCRTNAIVAMQYLIGGTATGAAITIGSLPAGVTSAYNATTKILTISGTPTATVTPGDFDFTITTSGGCSPDATITGRITVKDVSKISLDATAGLNAQAVCPGQAIATMQYKVEGTATGAAITVGSLPAGVTSSYNATTNIFTISGTPAATVTPGNFDFTITTSGGCSPDATIVGRITVNDVSKISMDVTSGANAQAVCRSEAIVPLKYKIEGSATGASITVGALPAGITSSYDVTTNILTISGAPATTVATGDFDFTITTSGGCTPNATIIGRITVKEISKVSLDATAGANAQAVCQGEAIVAMQYKIEGTATGAAITIGSLPAGITSSYNATTNVLTISGAPTTAVIPGNFDFTITTSGGCTPHANIVGRIIVKDVSKLTLQSAATTTSQSVCLTTSITPITYRVEGSATTAVLSGTLPAGVTGVYNAATKIFTISGAPTAVGTGTFNYTITTSGGCTPNVSLTGQINVKPNATITVLPTSGNVTQTLCIGLPITNITGQIGNGATGVTLFSGPLPTGLSWSINASGLLTISGTPTADGTYPYEFRTTGGCTYATLAGTIIVQPKVTLALTSATATTTQSVCPGEDIAAITYRAADGATGVTLTGLPAGIAGVFTPSTGVFRIEGRSNAAPGTTYNYSVTTVGGCAPPVTLTGQLTIKKKAAIALSTANNTQVVCINAGIVDIAYLLTDGAASATVTGLPNGITGTVTTGTGGTIFTLKGLPTETGLFNYTVKTVGGCDSASLTGSINVMPLPNVVVNEGYICVDDNDNPLPGASFPLTVTGFNSSRYSITWFDKNMTVVGTGATYNATTVGDFTVEVIDLSTATPCAQRATTIIHPSLPPKDVSYEVTNFFSETQIVTINVAPAGEYMYQLDGGKFQTSNQFFGLSSGEHEVIVKDKFACGIKTITFRIISFPKFFTPNDDGYNDFWNIPDLSDQNNSKIRIFDRYGKLMKEISPKGAGWDGMFNGNPAPADDYWFKVFFQEQGVAKEYGSHFSLKR